MTSLSDFIDIPYPTKKNFQAQYATIGVGAIMVIMTLVTIPLMDRAGRRTLHLVKTYFGVGF